jgi:hypothetical protein
MNTRRKFLFSGSLASAAFFTAKPLNTLANCLNPLTGICYNKNKLVLAHTGNAVNGFNNPANLISQLKNTSNNLLLLHAGCESPNINNLYDASLHEGEKFSVPAHAYKIVYKGNIKTGIIAATQQDSSAEQINQLAVYLKKEKNCHLVICLSQLGFKSQNGLNDMALAEASTHIDVITGGHTENFCIRPVVAQNKNKEEVIINHAGTNSLAFRKIEIQFDPLGKRKQVAISKAC